ncbi:MAG TPA: peptidoglycan DD-metalloendopeptidase family protein [Ferrovibrio sp.]|uniref:M23 family metallopeptidase n=1 Tax=Ferrovibrio sp. TaxID=1917215 RepID=UPI002ED35F52
MIKRWDSNRFGLARAVRTQKILPVAVAAAGLIAGGMLLQHLQTQTDTMKNVQPAVAEAFRVAPTLEAFVTQPDLWWPQALDPSDLLPARVLKKVAVAPGDTLMQLLTDAGADPAESHEAIVALADKFNPRKLKAGQEITLTFERNDADSYRLFELALSPSIEREVSVVRGDGGFKANETIREFNVDHARVTGEIEDSLYNAGIEAGLSNSLLGDFIRIFSYDIDFQREVRPGDRFEVFFERYYDDAGKTVKTGRITAAAMTVSGRELRYYYYRPSDSGEGDYFTPAGQSVRKALLRTPIDGARLTSRFGMRHHPILGYSLMHKGVDFGAAAGTPIQAAGDGTVDIAGWVRGYGNYVRLKHVNGYSTAYAHMSRIAVHAGQHVRQGQIVGYVGATGRATGPHLHYEVMVNGKQVNPSGVRFPSGRKLEGKEFARFRAEIAKVDAEMRSTPQLALLNTGD